MTIVSGIPRSGTSMMMNMLVEGGMEPVSDGVREADADNPRGYFEIEAVKRLHEDASWLRAARGKVVKVVHVHVKHLPVEPDLEYRVIAMCRAMPEIVASQRVMLRRRGEPGGKLSDERLGELYGAQLREALAWMRERPDFAVLEAHYDEILRRPEVAARAIDAFLGGGLDIVAMCAVVDPALNRSGVGSRDGRS